MRAKGKVISWDKDKAFGFIQLIGNNKEIFLHKNSLQNKTKTPQLNDIITFTLATDKQGRMYAANATFSGEKLRKHKAVNTGVNKFSLYLSVSFLVLLSSAALLGKLPILLMYIYFLLSLLTFMLYWIDKVKAEKKRYRIAESTLHLLSLIGGWPGAAIAQQLIRHKSQKVTFRQIYWLMVGLNSAALIWLFSPYGQATLTTVTTLSSYVTDTLPLILQILLNSWPAALVLYLLVKLWSGIWDYFFPKV